MVHDSQHYVTVIKVQYIFDEQTSLSYQEDRADGRDDSQVPEFGNWLQKRTGSAFYLHLFVPV